MKSAKYRHYLTIILGTQLFLMVLVTLFLSKNSSDVAIISMKVLTNSMSVTPIEVLIVERDFETLVWFSFMIGALVVAISISMKNTIA